MSEKRESLEQTAADASVTAVVAGDGEVGLSKVTIALNALPAFAREVALAYTNGMNWVEIGAQYGIPAPKKYASAYSTPQLGPGYKSVGPSEAQAYYMTALIGFGKVVKEVVQAKRLDLGMTGLTVLEKVALNGAEERNRVRAAEALVKFSGIDKEDDDTASLNVIDFGASLARVFNFKIPQGTRIRVPTAAEKAEGAGGPPPVVIDVSENP